MYNILYQFSDPRRHRVRSLTLVMVERHQRDKVHPKTQFLCLPGEQILKS